MFTIGLLIGIFPLVFCSSIETRSLQSLDPNALKAFLIPFRESILQRVAVEWNHTIGDSAKLQTDMQICSDKIKSSVENCKTCTVSACQSDANIVQTVSHSPTFTDYLGIAVNLLNPVQFLKEPLNEIGDKLGDLVDLLGSGSDSFIHSMASLGNTVGGAFTDAFHGLESGINTVGNTFIDLGGTAIHGITDVTNTIGDGLSSAGHAIENVGNTILHGIGSIFGRRQQASAPIDPKLRACMEKCTTCNALLITDQRQMISSVCGVEVVNFNDTVRTNVINIKGIFTAVSDKANAIITNVEVDPQSLNGLVYSTVYVTANIKGRYVRYQSSVHYDMMNSATSAQNIAAEYWQKWTK